MLPKDLGENVFRIDHDQAFQSNANFRYQRKNNGEWVSLIWRYDNRLVVSGVPTTDDALALTPEQQTTIGLSCDGKFATFTSGFSDCGGPVKSKLLNIPAPETANDDHNPARVKPRNLFNLGVGTDNLLRSDTHNRIGYGGQPDEQGIFV